MAWIESYQSLKDHPKTYALMDALRIRQREAIGMLHLLWWWALDAAPDGVITVSNRRLAYIMDWQGNPSKLVDAMVAAGFLERSSDLLKLHDWSDYTEHLYAKREANRKRQQEFRARSNALLTRYVTPLSHSRVTLRNGATVPTVYIPPITPQLENQETIPPKKEDTVIEQSPDLISVFECYEKNIGMLTPMLADNLKSMSKEYPVEWFPLAVNEAVKSQARNLRYIEKCLESWKAQGYPGRKEKKEKAASGVWNTGGYAGE